MLFEFLLWVIQAFQSVFCICMQSLCLSLGERNDTLYTLNLALWDWPKTLQMFSLLWLLLCITVDIQTSLHCMHPYSVTLQHMYVCVLWWRSIPATHTPPEWMRYFDERSNDGTVWNFRTLLNVSVFWYTSSEHFYCKNYIKQLFSSGVL